MADDKVCVLCGESCAGQPRIKNAKGAYAHKACVESRARSQSSADAHDEQPADEILGDGLDEAMLGDLPLPDEGDGTGGLQAACPGCGHVLASDVVVCTTCGFDSRSGKAMKTKVEKAPKAGRGKLTETSAVAAGASYLIGAVIGSAIGAGIGAGIWAGVIVAVQFQASMIAIVVGALTGIGAACGARGNVSILTGLIAIVFAVGGVVGGKWYGGSTLGDQVLNKEIALFKQDWRSLDEEGRAWYVQDDHAREMIIARLERGNDGGIADFNYQMALRSDNYPEGFPAEFVEKTDLWWWSMEPEEQAAYIEDFEDKRIAEFEEARGAVHEAGFLSTVGVRDVVYIAFAIILAGALGSNENTAPFVKT